MRDICDCDRPGLLQIEVVITSRQDSTDYHEIHIDRCRIRPTGPANQIPVGGGNPYPFYFYTWKFVFDINIGACSSASGSRSIRILDPNRTGGSAGWTGVSQIYRISWDIECKNECDGYERKCDTDKSEYRVVLESEAIGWPNPLDPGTFIPPNLPDPGPLRNCPPAVPLR